MLSLALSDICYLNWKPSNPILILSAITLSSVYDNLSPSCIIRDTKEDAMYLDKLCEDRKWF